MQLSSSEIRIALGSEDGFAVLDIPTRKIIAQGKGKYASLSPDGRALVFVDGDNFTLLSLDTGAKRQLLAGYQAREVGQWTPDGRFLLAAVRRMRPLDLERMIAVDVAGDSYLRVDDLSDENPGPSMYRWIKRSLLVP
jgi:hypothetical protein